MEDRIPVSPRQDEIQGRPHGGSAVAPVTPDIGLLGCNFEEIHGTRAQMSTTSGQEDLMDTIQRLEAENRALGEAQEEDIKEA